MTEEEAREALRAAYRERAELNKRIYELQEKMKELSPTYAALMLELDMP